MARLWKISTCVECAGKAFTAGGAEAEAVEKYQKKWCETMYRTNLPQPLVDTIRANSSFQMKLSTAYSCGGGGYTLFNGPMIFGDLYWLPEFIWLPEFKGTGFGGGDIMEIKRIDRAGMFGGFSAVACWANSLNGNGKLEDAIASLATLIQADCAVLVRSSFQELKPRIVAQYDSEAGKFPATPLKSYVTQIMGDNMRGAKRGSLWKMSECQDLDDAYCAGRDRVSQIGPRFDEVLVLTLRVSKNQADLIEFHFRNAPLQHNLDLLTMLTETLCNSWKVRSPGIISKKFKRSFLNPVSRETSRSEDMSILDIENPAKLSRSEFRICTLLKEGMTVSKIAQTLPICEATVRSHLSSIFSKTETTSQVELLHLLNRVPVAQGAANLAV